MGSGSVLLVLGTYSAMQLFLTRSSVNFLWWRAESVRQIDHFRSPKAAVAASASAPTWQEWVPTAMTAVLATAVLLWLALLLARSGRGAWAALAAALPLVPTQLVPGVWAPALANSAAYALVFPPGATEPSTMWAWLEAGIQSAAILLPAVVVGRMLPGRRPRVWTSDAVRRLRWPAGLTVGLLCWHVAVGADPDWGSTLRNAVYFAIGGLLVSGGLRWWSALGGVVLIPALASGLIRWTTDVSGRVPMRQVPI